MRKEFPKRHKTHIKESSSWRLLFQKIPREWIICDVTERDYGIDAYIELVTEEGNVTGDLCLVQLKSSDSVKWRNKNNDYITRFSGIKKSTVNYLNNFPVPVFLFLADLKNNSVYFANIKKQIRKQYLRFIDKKQKSMGFDLMQINEIGTDIGLLLFVASYHREKFFNEFLKSIRELIIHHKKYHEFIIDNQNLDCFLGVEEDVLLMLIHIYRTCQFLASYLGIKWDIISLKDAAENDEKKWKDSCYVLHQETLEKVLNKMEPMFIDILKRTKKIVKEQKQYWSKYNYILYRKCQELNIEDLKR